MLARKSFIHIARWEGLSYLLLFAVAMPLKYIAEMPEYVRIVGMIHGILFIAYCVILAWAMWEQRWSKELTVWCFIASLLPFGTMIMERRLPPPRHLAQQPEAESAASAT